MLWVPFQATATKQLSKAHEFFFASQGISKLFTLCSTLLSMQSYYVKKTICIPGGASGKEPACQYRRWKRSRFDPWVGKIPWRRAWQPTPGFLPAESHGQRSLAGYSPRVRNESDTSEVTQHLQWDTVVGGRVRRGNMCTRG